ncbi:alpha/beta hydrolase family protein, partial [Novosphingobium subterraneum]|uniref:alpha/beta hydrolase family protein n=2 Tax=Novosphingobium TaxID=165696 RepID=UPI003CFBFE7A
RVANEGENPVPHYWDHVMWVFGIDDREAFLAYADQITLDGQVDKIRVPFLVTHGENDRQIPVYNAHMSYDQATNSPKRSLRIFTKADFEVEHCGADNGTAMRDYIADWCAQTFNEMV